MIEILEIKDENTIGFSLDGKIEVTDIKRVFEELEKAAANNGKLRVYAEVRNFNLSDMSSEALKEDIKSWLKHPGLIPMIEKAVLVTDTPWLKTGFDIECALIPTMTGESFSFDEKDEAVQWLNTDHRAKSRMDLTISEFAETATLKAAGGFALGLLTASLFSEKQRKNIGWAVLLGGIAAGLPLGLKVLNNNRKLLNS